MGRRCPHQYFFKPPAAREARKAGVIVFSSKNLFVFLLLLLCFAVQNEDSTDRAEIFTEASHHALTPSKPCPSGSDSDSSNADSKFDDFVDFDQSVDDFQNFFGQMDTECDVDRIQTVLNVIRFPDPTNRPSNRDRIDRQSYLLTIFKLFSARWTPNATLTTHKQFEHCTISGSTESAAESGPNRSPEASADDFQSFFEQMGTECDVDHVQTV